MEPMKYLCESEMSSLAPESKLIRKKSLGPVRSFLMYIPMTTKNKEFYAASAEQLDS